jgi:hypothetical protein
MEYTELADRISLRVPQTAHLASDYADYTDLAADYTELAADHTELAADHTEYTELAAETRTSAA